MKTSSCLIWALLAASSVLAQDCNDARWDEPDPIEENPQPQATQCDVLIGSDREEMDEEDSLRLECNTRITGPGPAMRAVFVCT